MHLYCSGILIPLIRFCCYLHPELKKNLFFEFEPHGSCSLVFSILPVSQSTTTFHSRLFGSFSNVGLIIEFCPVPFSDCGPIIEFCPVPFSDCGPIIEFCSKKFSNVGPIIEFCPRQFSISRLVFFVFFSKLSKKNTISQVMIREIWVCPHENWDLNLIEKQFGDSISVLRKSLPIGDLWMVGENGEVALKVEIKQDADLLNCIRQHDRLRSQVNALSEDRVQNNGKTRTALLHIGGFENFQDKDFKAWMTYMTECTLGRQNRVEIYSINKIILLGPFLQRIVHNLNRQSSLTFDSQINRELPDLSFKRVKVMGSEDLFKHFFNGIYRFPKAAVSILLEKYKSLKNLAKEAEKQGHLFLAQESCSPEGKKIGPTNSLKVYEALGFIVVKKK